MGFRGLGLINVPQFKIIKDKFLEILPKPTPPFEPYSELGGVQGSQNPQAKQHPEAPLPPFPDIWIKTSPLITKTHFEFLLVGGGVHIRGKGFELYGLCGTSGC